MNALRISLGLVTATSLWLLARAAVVLPAGAWVYVRPWCTVVAALGLFVGSVAAFRGRTWGVLLCAAAGASFVGAWAVDIAPAHFVAIGVVGLLPTACVARRLLGFDRRAGVGAMSLAVILGSAAALAAGPALDAFLR